MRIEILGASFTINSDEDPEYVSRVVTYLRQRVTETRQRLPKADPLTVALVTGLQLVDEVHKERRRQAGHLSPEDAEAAFRITEDLINRIDATLPDNETKGA